MQRKTDESIYYLNRGNLLAFIVLILWSAVFVLSYATGHYLDYLAPALSFVLMIGAPLALMMAVYRGQI